MEGRDLGVPMGMKAGEAALLVGVGCGCSGVGLGGMAVVVAGSGGPLMTSVNRLDGVISVSVVPPCGAVGVRFEFDFC